MFADRYFANRYFAPRYFVSYGEEAVVVPPGPSGNPSGGGGRVYGAYPQAPAKRKRKKVIREPVEYEVSGPLSSEYEHAKLPEWNQDAWEASLKTLNFLETERRVRRRRTDAALLALLVE